MPPTDKNKPPAAAPAAAPVQPPPDAAAEEIRARAGVTPPESSPTPKSWEDDAGEISIEEREAIRFATIQIVNGDPRFAGHFRERGAFFMPEGAIDGGPPAIPGVCDWAPGVLVTKDNKKQAGFFAPFLFLALIRSRKCWTVGAGKGPPRFGWNEYAAAKAYGEHIGESARSHLQGLCVVDGIAEPVAITFKGMHTAGLTVRDGWADRVRRYVMTPASAIVSKKQGRRIALPSLCFRVGLGFQTNPDGTPYYWQVGEGDDVSAITPIVLIDPVEVLEPAQIGAYYVGPEARARHEEIHRAADPWISEWTPEALAARREGRGLGTAKPATAAREPAPTFRAEREELGNDHDPDSVF
jgi:hypothetical protein